MNFLSKKTKLIFALICAGTVCAGSAAAAYPYRDAVVVNPYIMQNLGPEPTVPLQYYSEYQSHKPFVVTGAKQANQAAYYAARSGELSPPPRKKPKSNLNEVVFGETARKSGKFKATPKSSFRAAAGGFFPAAGQFVTNIAGNMYGGYRWNDIDPRTRGGAGANVTVTRPNSVAGTVVGSVGFDKDETDLDSNGMAQVKKVGSKLKASNVPAELRGYATAPKNNPAEARRTALTRILQVRDTLIGMGVSGSQLGVKPMGTPESGAKDRVDIVIKK